MDIVLFGLNHLTAPLEIRERLSFMKQDAPEIMRDLREKGVFFENLLISTCNRTEVYGLSTCANESVERLQGILADIKQLKPDLLRAHGYTFLNVQAVQHLFRVAAGLDSLVVGEVEILGQLKDAYRMASGVAATGPFLNRLFQHCFRVGKRARSETGISDGAISVGSIAVDLARKVLGRLDGKSALLIGAGETGQLVARHLKQAGIGSLVITNRTQDKAEDLAANLEGRVLEFEKFADKLSDFDLLITAIGAPERTITRSMLRTKRWKYPLLIDLGVPRDIDPEIDKLSGVIVYNIDDLESLVREKIDRRAQEAPKVEKIIQDEAMHFIKWYQAISSQNTITDLRDKLEEIRKETLAKWKGRLSPHEYKTSERITEDLLNKILHISSQSLKGCELDCEQRSCETCEMFDTEEGPAHGHYSQELKCMFARMLFDLEEKDRNA